MKRVYPHIITSLILLVILLCPQNLTPQNQPRLVTIIILDQFAYHYIPKLRNHFHYGLKELLEHGIVYTNAYHAQGVPETTPGHHALSTGTLPKDHGAILNEWFDKGYHGVIYGYDHPDKIVQKHTYIKDIELSCEQTKVDGLSDQFAQTSTSRHHTYAFALSIKPQPALVCALRMGKAIWFDEYAGNFTSNMRYFNQLPEWLVNFNKNHKISDLTQVTWNLMYPADNEAYNFPYIHNYDYTNMAQSLITCPSIAIGNTDDFYKRSNGPHSPYDLFIKTPHASQALIDLAKTCISHVLKDSSNRMILWLCIGNLDLLCHYYGPHAQESIDTVYHFDQQIQEYMDYAKKLVGEKNCLFVLTADHGIAPIPEIMQQQGFTLAKRIMAQPLMAKMNDMIQKKYKLADMVKIFEPTFFILNKEALATVSPAIQQEITNDLKKFLLHQEGIKHVWSRQELEQAQFGPNDLENFYKNQLYRHRFGDIICMPEPYCQITNYPTGTSHLSPYDYDTHVPLILYQKGIMPHAVITNKVWAGQLPVTLAHLLDINRPSASTYNLLPGVA